LAEGRFDGSLSIMCQIRSFNFSLTNSGKAFGVVS
jgi:hypothetical protein